MTYQKKSTIEEIKKRFDNDVERFSNLETGQTTIIDATLLMELITQAAVKSTINIKRVLDIGCGAGNNTIKLLEYVCPFDCVLVDLSLPMLLKAKERISLINTGSIEIIQSDFRKLEIPTQGFDVIIAAAVLHHLRDDKDWEEAFKKLYNLTSPGGSIWITDLVSHEFKAVDSLMWTKYGDYLASIGGHDYRKKVLEYIDKEDSPRPVSYQLDLLRKVGYKYVDILHKNSCFAAFGAIKVN
jgi:tRNA (cmo5U34)-methyltransferase